VTEHLSEADILALHRLNLYHFIIVLYIILYIVSIIIIFILSLLLLLTVVYR